MKLLPLSLSVSQLGHMSAPVICHLLHVTILAIVWLQEMQQGRLRVLAVQDLEPQRFQGVHQGRCVGVSLAENSLIVQPLSCHRHTAHCWTDLYTTHFVSAISKLGQDLALIGCVLASLIAVAGLGAKVVTKANNLGRRGSATRLMEFG